MGRLIVLGITGGVGVGKSTVLAYLKQRYNAVIIMADIVAKTLMEPGGETYEEILKQFGSDLAGEDGQINKELLARRIFEQGYGTSKINELVHPMVIRQISKKIEQQRLEAEVDPSDMLHLLVVEAALLFEGHADVLCDKIWYIHADSEVRIKRLMESRGYSREKCLAIMENQMSHDEFAERCDVILDNNGEPDEVRGQIDEQIRALN